MGSDQYHLGDDSFKADKEFAEHLQRLLAQKEFVTYPADKVFKHLDVVLKLPRWLSNNPIIKRVLDWWYLDRHATLWIRDEDGKAHIAGEAPRNTRK